MAHLHPERPIRVIYARVRSPFLRLRIERGVTTFSGKPQQRSFAPVQPFFPMTSLRMAQMV